MATTQYSVRKNPMDRVAQKSTVHRAAKSVRHNLVTEQQSFITPAEIGCLFNTQHKLLGLALLDQVGPPALPTSQWPGG